MNYRLSARPSRTLRMLAGAVVLNVLLAAHGEGQAAALPADVETVITGGLWEHGTQEGRYRVVIRSTGFEHVISALAVDWILSATESDTARVVASLAFPAGPVGLHEPELVRTREAWMLRILSTDTHYEPPKRDTLLIRLGPPGTATLERR